LLTGTGAMAGALVGMTMELTDAGCEDGISYHFAKCTWNARHD